MGGHDRRHPRRNGAEPPAPSKPASLNRYRQRIDATSIYSGRAVPGEAVTLDTLAQADLVEAYRTQLEDRPVLLYDGVCVVCNRTVQFLLRHEHDAALRFVPLESPLGRALLSLYDTQPGCDPGKEGVILISGALMPAAQLSRRTDAFAAVLQRLRSPWPIIGRLLRWTPRLLREPAYTLFARYRYRLFGRHDVCPLPTPEQRARILGIPG